MVKQRARSALSDEANVTVAVHTDAAARSGRARVLVAEDNPANQRLMEIILTSLGYRVQVAADGREAARAAEAVAFDLILLDLNMPVADGFEAARRIRMLPGERGETPIVAVTGDGNPAVMERIARAGMNGCIVKPFDITALTELVAELTSGKPGSDAGGAATS